MTLQRIARRRSEGVRVRALALAIVLLGGGFGLPAADAFLYHVRAPDVHASRPQAAEAGAPLGHAFRCTLDDAFPGPRLAAALLALPPLTQLERNAGPTAPVLAPRPADRYRCPQPRSPPITLG